jgi:hypothetical protein
MTSHPPFNVDDRAMLEKPRSLSAGKPGETTSQGQRIEMEGIEDTVITAR